MESSCYITALTFTGNSGLTTIHRWLTLLSGGWEIRNALQLSLLCLALCREKPHKFVSCSPYEAWFVKHNLMVCLGTNMLEKRRAEMVYLKCFGAEQEEVFFSLKWFYANLFTKVLCKQTEFFTTVTELVESLMLLGASCYRWFNLDFNVWFSMGTSTQDV